MRRFWILHVLLLALFATLGGCAAPKPTATSVPIPAPAATPPPPMAAPTESPIPPTVRPTPAVLATQPLPTAEPIPTLGPTPSLRASMPLSVTTNISYTHTRTLDVYAPVTAGDWPLVVVLHQNASTKEYVYGLSKAIAGQGAVVFAPDYEESTQGMAPGRLMLSGFENAACAIRFARAHVAEYGGHGDRRVLVVGHSQGGMVGAVMMFAGDQFPGDCLTEAGSAMPDAFVGVDGGYDPIPFLSEEKLRAAPAEAIKIDPFTYIGQKPIREGVRFVLFAGDFEPAVIHSQAFRDALQAAGYDVSLTRIPGAGHVEIASGRVPQITRAIADLLRPQ